jgi:hypothetical protein
LSTKILLTKADDASAALNAYRATVTNEDELKKISKFGKHLDNVIEEVGFISKISKIYKGLQYEIFIYSDNLIFKVNNEKFLWNNKARLWGGELEFDFNTYGVKGLGQEWTNRTFEIFGYRIKTIKVEWKQLPNYPEGESLGYKQFSKVFDETYDQYQAVKSTTFYETMSKKGYKNIKDVYIKQKSIVVLLTK